MQRAGRDIQLEGPDGSLAAYMAVPASRRGRGLLVVSEWWGLVDHIRDVCDRFAREGLVALAPDLYRGRTTSDPDVAGRLMMDLEIPRAARDLDAAVAALLGHPAVDGPRVGVLGFCMGGQLALFAATRNPRIGAVVDFYGIHPNVTPDLAALEAPVLGIFAENDAFIPTAAARKLESDLRAAGKRVTLRIVPGVGHAFMNDTRPEAHDAEAARISMADALAFLRRELA